LITSPGLLSPGLFRIYSVTPGHPDSLRTVLTAMLNKEIVDPLMAARCVVQAGWGMDDDYLLLLIIFPESMRNLETLGRCMHIYERLFPDCIALKHQDSLVLIIHRDSSELLSECLPKLEKQLNAHNAVCGMSFPFKGIAQISAQYVNAETAVHYGDKSKRIRPLSEAISFPIISKIAADMPLYPLCHREAVRIYEYDRLNGTELLLTLETYLMHYKSLKSAAEALYIHRNTMTYRLGCIEKISRLSLDDPRERLHLLLSCIVLRILGRQK
jgi:sugar diacid utilization regulator